MAATSKRYMYLIIFCVSEKKALASLSYIVKKNNNTSRFRLYFINRIQPFKLQETHTHTHIGTMKGDKLLFLFTLY